MTIGGGGIENRADVLFLEKPPRNDGRGSCMYGRAIDRIGFPLCN